MARKKTAAAAGGPSQLEPFLREIYLRFDRESYRAGGIPGKFKQLIAIAAALTSGGQATLEQHLRLAQRAGASRREISETIAIAAGISAATLVERAERAERGAK
jgi:AhpD family alkylhydroperoxidase